MRSSEPQSLQAIFLLFYSQNITNHVPGVPSGDRENWGKETRREGSLGKIDMNDLELFRNGSVHEFYSLEALITLEQMNTSVVKNNWEEC